MKHQGYIKHRACNIFASIKISTATVVAMRIICANGKGIEIFQPLSYSRVKADISYMNHKTLGEYRPEFACGLLACRNANLSGTRVVSNSRTMILKKSYSADVKEKITR